MLQELKIRISNYQEVEERLKKLGALFITESDFIDTYFNQSRDEVLKITTTENNSLLINLNSVNGKFGIVSKQSIENVDKLKKELSDKYGIRAVLQGKRRRFKLEDLEITINFIDEVGEFLILTGENPTEDFIVDKLGIKNPEYIRVSFDELKNK